MANQYFGDGNSAPYLGVDGYCYYDWYRPPNLAKARATLAAGQQIKLQAMIRWDGNGFVPYVVNKTGEHAILAFTQRTLNQSAVCPQKGITEALLNSPRHPNRQYIHANGVGATLSPKGLALEIWHGNGTASVFSAEYNRCMVNIPSGEVTDLCISSNPATSSFITDPVNFNGLQKGADYWVRLTLTGNPDGAVGWTRVHADLLLQNAQGIFKIQEAQIRVITNTVFPDNGTIESLIGRSGPEHPETNYIPGNIYFWAFDSGF